MQLGIIGQPVQQSLSPRIHRWIARKVGSSVHYDRLETGAADLRKRLVALQAGGFAGVNVTSPLKTAVLPFVQRLDEMAKQTGSVNTLKFCLDGAIEGTNTDVFGFSYQLGDMCSGRVGVLGAGGVVPSVLQVLGTRNPSQIHVFNRRPPQGASVARMIEAHESIAYHPMSSFDDMASTLDILIHCLPGAALPLIEGLAFERLRSSIRVIDLNYGGAADRLRRSVGCQHLSWEDGRRMLCAQAFQSFQFWTGRALDTAILKGLIDEIVEIASA